MKIPLEQVFCQNMKNFRKNAKLSQEKLSFLLDKNINYINMIESGKSLPPIPMIEKIAEVLNIQPYQLFMTDDATDATVLDKVKFAHLAAESISENAEHIVLNLLDNMPSDKI